MLNRRGLFTLPAITAGIISTLHAEKMPFSANVSISAKNDVMADELRSAVFRELRQLGDVITTDSKSFYRLTITVIEIATTYPVFAAAMLVSYQDNPEAFLQLYVFTATTSEQLAKMAISSFDVDVLEPSRKLQTRMDEYLKTYPK
jgi:hypothetical protein